MTNLGILPLIPLAAIAAASAKLPASHEVPEPQIYISLVTTLQANPSSQFLLKTRSGEKLYFPPRDVIDFETKLPISYPDLSIEDVRNVSVDATFRDAFICIDVGQELFHSFEILRDQVGDVRILLTLANRKTLVGRILAVRENQIQFGTFDRETAKELALLLEQERLHEHLRSELKRAADERHRIIIEENLKKLRALKKSGA